MFGRMLGVGTVGARSAAEGALALAMLVVVSCMSCSQATPVDGASSSTHAPVSTSEEGALPIPDPADTVQLFADLAAEVAPLAIYAPTALPEGAMLADSWAPVIDSTDPGSYDGPSRRNPYVVGSGSEAEAQVVYRVGEGWLVFIENFRGDLGDVTGEGVGSVDDKPATLFSVNGGELVQWSYNACWYGVFGRGVSRAVILAAALGMVVER